MWASSPHHEHSMFKRHACRWGGGGRTKKEEYQKSKGHVESVKYLEHQKCQKVRRVSNILGEWKVSRCSGSCTIQTNDNKAKLGDQRQHQRRQLTSTT